MGTDVVCSKQVSAMESHSADQAHKGSEKSYAIMKKNIEYVPIIM